MKTYRASAFINFIEGNLTPFVCSTPQPFLYFLFLKLRNIPGLFLCDEPGLGKTVTTAGILAHLKSLKPDFKSFVVVKKPLVDHWKLELEAWTSLRVNTLPHRLEERVCKTFPEPIFV